MLLTQILQLFDFFFIYGFFWFENLGLFSFILGFDLLEFFQNIQGFSMESIIKITRQKHLTIPILHVFFEYFNTFFDLLLSQFMQIIDSFDLPSSYFFTLAQIGYFQMFLIISRLVIIITQILLFWFHIFKIISTWPLINIPVVFLILSDEFGDVSSIMKHVWRRLPF